jgi:hypothetical protein
LRDALLDAARFGEAFQIAADAWGTHWRLEAAIRRQEKNAMVRTIWIVRIRRECVKIRHVWVL